MAIEATIERSIDIGVPADAAWRALSAVRGLVVPGVFNATSDHDGDETVQTVELTEGTIFRQRLEDRDDAAMRIGFVMIEGDGVPWSAYRSSIQVQPTGEGCRIAAVVTYTTEPEQADMVGAMLRDVVDLGLAGARARLEGEPG